MGADVAPSVAADAFLSALAAFFAAAAGLPFGAFAASDAGVAGGGHSASVSAPLQPKSCETCSSYGSCCVGTVQMQTALLFRLHYVLSRDTVCKLRVRVASCGLQVADCELQKLMDLSNCNLEDSKNLVLSGKTPAIVLHIRIDSLHKQHMQLVHHEW